MHVRTTPYGVFGDDSTTVSPAAPAAVQAALLDPSTIIMYVAALAIGIVLASKLGDSGGTHIRRKQRP